LIIIIFIFAFTMLLAAACFVFFRVFADDAASPLASPPRHAMPVALRLRARYAMRNAA